METGTVQTHREMLRRFTDQPEAMPPPLAARFADALGGPVVRYAWTDLPAAGRASGAWLAAGPTRLGVACASAEPGGWRIETWDRAAVREVREQTGLSSSALRLFLDGASAAGGVETLRYTHRQRLSVGHVRALLDLPPGAEPGGAGADAVYAAAVAEAVEEAQASVIVNRRAVVWRLLAYLRPYRRHVAAGASAALAATLVSLAPPYLTGRLIDRVVRPFESGAIDPGAARQAAWLILAGIVATFVTRQLAVWVRLRTMAVLGEWVARDLRNDLFEHLQRLSVRFFSRRQTGSIISRVSSDTDRIWDFIAFGVVELALAAVTLAGLSVVLVAMDWRLGLLVTLPVPLFFVAIRANGRGIRRLFLRAWHKWSDLTDVLSDDVPGIRVVKVFDQEQRETGRFRRSNESACGEFLRVHGVWTRFWPLLMLGIHAMTVLVWAVALPRLLGSGRFGPPLTTGTFISFLMYLGLFYEPVHTFGQMSRTINRATSSAHRVFELLDTRVQETGQRGRALRPVRGEVRFEHVSFSYDGTREAVRDLSLVIRPGEMVGLVGPSGAGKTTLTHLVTRFYDPGRGRVLIDGVDLKELDLGLYRRQIGVVMQDPFLFSGSILENIRYADPDATLEQVLAAARAANAHDFICGLPFGYETRVGERGHTLSGGERQRVSIARAVLHNPRILILDEATSSVDTETERRIQEALDRLVEGRTVIAVAHRLSTLKRAKRLIVLREGAIVEEGTHEQLLADGNGVYRRLHDLQQELHGMYAV